MNGGPRPGAADGTVTASGTPYIPRAAVGVLLILAGMAMMVTYVETMVLPAFKQFVTFFDGPSASTVAWILSAYLLVGTVATPVFGKLGDKYGKKQMLLIVMSVYAVAVSVAGFTPNLGSALGVSVPNQIYLLIGVRAVQGIGMAMFPLAFAMIPETFPARRVGPAQGAVSAMFALGAAIGLALGGWLAQTYGWQFTYHTVIPFAIVLVGLAAFELHESPHRHPNPIDVPGITSLGFALAMFLVGITEGTNWGWTNFTAASLGPLPWGTPEFFLLAVVGMAFFVYWEPRTKFPVLAFSALRVRNILVSNVGGLVVGVTMFLTFVSLVLISEYPFPPGLGLSESRFGQLAVWSALSMLAFGPFLGFASSRFGPKPVMMLGFALSTGGAALLAAFHATVLELTIFPIPILVGCVGVMIAMTNVIVLTADRRELGIQTGINQTFRNLGSAIGPVLATTIVASFLTPYFLPPAGPTISVYANAGFQWVFLLIAGLSAAGFVFSLALRNFRYGVDGVRNDAPSAAASAGPPVEELPAVPAASPSEP